MNYDWTAEESELIQRVGGVFDGPALDETAALEKSDLAGIGALTRKFLGKLAATGYLALAAGPAGRTQALGHLAAMETVGRASGSLLLAAESSARLFGGLLAGWGGPGSKSILDKIQSGEAVGAVALAEPGGPEPREGRLTVGQKDGDGYRVSGLKSFVSNGLIADYIAVAGDLDGAAAFFIVRPGQAGVTTGDRIETLGYNGLAVSALELSGVKVPRDMVIGPFDDGAALDYLKNVQDLVLIAASLGVMGRTHDAATAHAKTYHRGTKPIFAHQEVRFKLADTYTLLFTSRWLAYRAAWHYATGDREAPVLIDCAKVFTAESAERIAALAMQVLAGRGYVSGNAVEQGYREAKYAALAGTTSELARMRIAEDVLRRSPV